MTPSELKYKIEQSGNCEHFFTRKTMSFFGDTMRNYGVRLGEAFMSDYDLDGNYVACGRLVVPWELYRRHAVKHGLTTSAFFDSDNFKRVFPPYSARKGY